MSKLVIVESPAKAKTIGRFLDAGYDVQASYGHVRDLPERADEIPEEFKKLKWAKLGVNVEGGFEPLYIVPSDKKRHVDALKRASKGATEILLATDEDREGESISWHILQLLKPSKKTKISRIVFHEITPEAISDALRNPRSVDEDLVRAQETRRILDRLYGYSLSPVLWKKVAPKLSAGRVQSVAVRLTVERERQRIAFHEAEYWDLEADLDAGQGQFKAKLSAVSGQRVATGKSFDPNTGLLKDKALWLKRDDVGSLHERFGAAKPWTVTRVETSPAQQSPPPPFMTSTLQQEANRKLRFTSRRTMQIAQGLYEGVDLGGERIGLITYMRTDSLNLAERAIEQARDVIRDLYGAEYLPDKPNRYRTKSKGAQEAHEAIRPTDLSLRPQDVRKYLDNDQFALYDLIWKRTIACQMPPARLLRTAVDVEVSEGGQTLTFSASGRQIVFPGYLRAYVEGSDDPEVELEGQESILPPLKENQELGLLELRADEHHTKPPARYTEASLVKKLEEEGVGRPSTYATIIGTIQDRGYVFKRANELVPTFTAFAVTELLERHFHDLVDTRFTARMEDQLDDIAEGKRDWVKHLAAFYLGDGPAPGLQGQIETETAGIPFPSIPIGSDPSTEEAIIVRVGRFGTFLQRGEGGQGNTAPIPEDLAPAELTLETALELLHRKLAGAAAVGVDPASGRCVFVRKGRFGSYLEVEAEEGEDKPKRVTIPPDVVIGELDEADVADLLRFPRTLGMHPAGGEVIATVGQYGAYIKWEKETRKLEAWRQALAIDLERALAMLAQPRIVGRGRGEAKVAIEPIKEFGALEGAQGPVRLLPGRYGPYVTDGKTNATLPKEIEPESLTAERALALILAKAGAPKTKRKSFRRTRSR